jgi:pyridinium-3,5-biscarboxylic acid mononucleotide sulfurtransferase
MIMAESIEHAADQLTRWVVNCGKVIVAFSGGVDSAVVAAAAYRALGIDALAVTSQSASVPRWQAEAATKTAAEIGIRHLVVATDEVARPEYQQNTANRCFFCKETLYATLRQVAEQEGIATILSGTNADDLGDHRPGLLAGQQAEVLTPLADLGFQKEMVRGIAKLWGLAVWDLPAGPCLASRIAYGVEVTPTRLRMIEAAEWWLRGRGFEELRVRLHAGGLARIEVPLERIAELTIDNFAGEIVSEFKRIGFTNITLDLAGLRSGNLNGLIQLGS